MKNGVRLPSLTNFGGKFPQAQPQNPLLISTPLDPKLSPMPDQLLEEIATFVKIEDVDVGGFKALVEDAVGEGGCLGKGDFELEGVGARDAEEIEDIYAFCVCWE